MEKRRIQAHGKKILRTKKVRDDVREREDRNSKIQNREGGERKKRDGDQRSSREKEK